jgi:hypothetical protein
MKPLGKYMKKRKRSFFLFAAVLIASSSGVSVYAQNPKDKIIEASNNLFNPPVSQEILADSLAQLLDTAVFLSSESPHKDEIARHIIIARDLLKETSLFNDKARQYISLAYRMITNGQKYQRPEELDEFVTPAEAQEKAMNYAKNLIEKSLSELETGHREEAARLLLELVLMVVTPVSG